MKIEKINENQIRCTLTREDLVSRQIKLSELAYGSDKARALFRELMEQASYQYGFDAEDIPLMIEAVPLSTESIVLVVTKVDTPDELDTRFSQFTDSDEDDDYLDYDNTPPSLNNASASDILNMFNKMINKVGEIKTNSENNEALPVDITKMYVFTSLETLISLASLLNSFYDGDNSLYKNPADGYYYLVFHKSNSSPEVYNRVCNILAEYGNQDNFVIGTDDYMAEHYDTIARHNALQLLASI